jgi:hypothetical protein
LEISEFQEGDSSSEVLKILKKIDFDVLVFYMEENFDNGLNIYLNKNNENSNLLISTYNWPESLDLVLKALFFQTHLPNEILS